jgi:O-Antigen ligase
MAEPNALFYSARRLPLALSKNSAGAWYGDSFAVFIAVIVLAFPLAGVLSSVFGLSSNVLTTASRFVVFAVGIVVFGRNFLAGQLRLPSLLLLLFFLAYGFRLMWSYFFEFKIDALVAFNFFILATLVPALIATTHNRWVGNSTQLIDGIVWMGAIFLIIVVALRLSGVNDFAYSETSNSALARQGFERLNPIALGATAAAIAGVALFGALSKRSIFYRMVCVFDILTGLYMLLASGSRGPILGFAGSVVITALANRRARASVILGLIALLPLLLFSFVDVNQTLERSRFATTGSDANSLERFIYYVEAWDAFLSSPIVGANFELPITLGWPHNIYLESLMAVGVTGGGLFFYLLFKTYRTAFGMLRRGPDALATILFQHSIIGLFSGSLWATSTLFVIMAVFLHQNELVGPEFQTARSSAS